VPNKFTEWRWDVTPKDWGRHTLTLLITASVELHGETASHDMKLKEKTIHVNVDRVYVAKRFFGDWGAKLIPPAGIFGLLGGFVTWWRKRRR
jgi:hypothetical protein